MYDVVKIGELVVKALKKGGLPLSIYENFYKTFCVLDREKDLSLFNVKPIGENFHRMRKGKYRAIFHLENDNVYIDLIAKRDEVYKLWEQKQ